jgi:glycosyltransferase involved in cell wall biosynthesis
MVSYSFYDNDNRVRRYAEILAKTGHAVDIISLRALDGPFDRINGVNIYRVQGRRMNERGKWDYLFRILRFFFIALYHVSRNHLREPYDLVHVHNVPDFLVFAAIIPKLARKRIVLDIHDILPEFYAAKFHVDENSTIFKMMLLVERVSCSFSDHVIVSNHIWYKKLIARSVNPGKCSVIMNYPDPSTFHQKPRTRKHDNFVIIYPGTLNYHQGVDIAIKSLSIIKKKYPKVEFHVYGDGGDKINLEKLVKDSDLGDIVIFKGRIPINKIAEEMSNADLGVVPKRDDGFGGEAFSTKILEFMSLGVTVVVSGTKIDTYYFNDSVVKFFKPGDVDDLANSILQLIQDQGMRKGLAENALKFVEDFSWENRKSEYLGLVNRLNKCKVGELGRLPGTHNT